MKKDTVKLKSEAKLKPKIGTKMKTKAKSKPSIRRSGVKTKVKLKKETKTVGGRVKKNSPKRVKKVVAKKNVNKKVKPTNSSVKKSNSMKRKITQKQKMSDVSWGYLIAGIFEAVMAIPIIGWLMGMGSSGFFWIVGLIINIVVLILVVKSKKGIAGNVVGIIANIIGWVPILGWFFHLIATILLFVLFFKEERK